MLIGKEKVPTVEEYERAVANSSDPDSKKVAKLGELNKEAYEDIILSISHAGQ